MNFKNYLQDLGHPGHSGHLSEKVTPDCADGSGVIPDGPYKGWKVIRTSHLDDDRKNGKDRDVNFDCDTFDAIITKFLQKRPMGVKDGKYSLSWRNIDGYQNTIVAVKNGNKSITFITVIQMNKKSARDYHAKSGQVSIDLGIIKEPN